MMLVLKTEQDIGVRKNVLQESKVFFKGGFATVLSQYLVCFLNTHPYFLPSHLRFYDITDALSLFSFPSLPEFHTLLQICSVAGFVYDHACFGVYVYLWVYLPCMRENMGLS
jgi:hypothetical protein